MDTIEKVQTLGEAARYDLCGACGESHRMKDDMGRWIYPAALPDGKTVKLLKILLTNACDNNCLYCFNRKDRDFQRTSFKPEELAYLFDQLCRAEMVQGLFLSSAVRGSPDRTMEQMIATAEILRRNYLYKGYIHLKILPGASWGCVERATQLADRVSVNLEAPGQKWLRRLTPDKDSDDLLAPLRWVRRLLEGGGERRVRRAGQTTQFVVGAAGEPDKEILQTTERLYQELKLARVYFSAFQPLPGTPLEDRPATPLLREHRLYQTDFLFRRYGFTFEELIFDEEGNLPLEADPKMVWALNHPQFFPVEVNRATREELLRVPGIGPRSARRIIKGRRLGRLRTLEDLQRLGAVAKRAAPFITLGGKRPPFQLSLRDALSGKTPDRAEALTALSLSAPELIYYR